MTNILFPALSFIISLSAYFLTLRLCLGWSGDSAKFQFLGKVYGIAGTKIKVFVNNNFLPEMEHVNGRKVYHPGWRKGANVVEFRTYQFQRTKGSVSELRDLYFALEYIRI